MSARLNQRRMHAYAVLGLAAVILYCAAWCFSSSRKKPEEWNHSSGLAVELERKAYTPGSRQGRWFPHVRCLVPGGVRISHP